MNKDVIYIEPEDDITDIILKIENSKEKIVALVPPKKAGVFRSVVNIKLIAKAGVTSEKTIVLVTVDPSIVKLAAAARIPVAKNLQSAPVIPEVETEEEKTTEKEELVEESDGAVETKEDVEDLNPSEEEKDKEKEAEKSEEEEEEKKEKRPKPAKKKSGNVFGRIIDWLKDHKKIAILLGVCGVALIGFLIWAFVIAPAVDIVVAIKTDQKNFSENVTFTDQLEKEDAKAGKFYLEQKTIDIPQQIEFEATGKKNLGEKAHGDVTLRHVFWTSGVYSIDSLTVDGLSFIATPTSSISWDGERISQCDNIKNITGDDEDDRSDKKNKEFRNNGCVRTVRVSVTAVEAGTKYNIQPSCSWLTLSGVGGCSEGAMTGGTDNEITVVQQSDIIKAQTELTNSKEAEVKKKLYDSIDDSYYVIDTSFEQKTSSVESTPAADEEVKEGVKPSIKTTTTASVYVIDKVKLEQFIEEKAKLDDDQKIYDVKNIYIENMSNISINTTSKLKAQYYVGPKITESEVVDRIKGKGLGDAQREIRDIYGVSDVKIDTSYPWVMAIPGDPNKVGVRFEVKDQNGNDIGNKDKTDNKDSDGDEDEDKDKKDSGDDD